MSHESIDTNRPYLVPRNSGNVEVWHVETNEDGTPKMDENGWIVLSGQHEETNAEGEQGIPSKSAHPDALSDKVQGHYADILGQSRLNATPEQFERYSVVNDELAETALEAMGLEGESDEENEETAEGRSPLLTEFFEETRFNAINDLKDQLAQRAGMIENELTQLDHVVSQALYAGGSNETINIQLRNSFESLQQLVIARDNPAEALSEKIVPLIHQAIEINDAIRRDESSSDESRYDARKVEELVGDLDMANKGISYAYNDIREAFIPHGRLESEVQELLRTNQGYEMMIALIKSKVSTAMEDVFSIRAKLNGMGYALEDLDRLKNR